MVGEVEKTPKCIGEQFQRLWRCSDKNDMTECNEWRRNNPDEEIRLEGEYSKFDDAAFQGVNLGNAKLKGVSFVGANLRQAFFWRADLKGANLAGAKLQRASLCESYLRRDRIQSADIRGTKCILAEVDGVSLISNCKFDSETDFTEVGLDSARIDPGLKTALKNNIRCIPCGSGERFWGRAKLTIRN